MDAKFHHADNEFDQTAPMCRLISWMGNFRINPDFRV